MAEEGQQHSKLDEAMRRYLAHLPAREEQERDAYRQWRELDEADRESAVGERLIPEQQYETYDGPRWDDFLADSRERLDPRADHAAELHADPAPDRQPRRGRADASGQPPAQARDASHGTRVDGEAIRLAQIGQPDAIQDALSQPSRTHSLLDERGSYTATTFEVIDRLRRGIGRSGP